MRLSYLFLLAIICTSLKSVSGNTAPVLIYESTPDYGTSYQTGTTWCSGCGGYQQMGDFFTIDEHHSLSKVEIVAKNITGPLDQVDVSFWNWDGNLAETPMLVDQFTPTITSLVDGSSVVSVSLPSTWELDAGGYMLSVYAPQLELAGFDFEGGTSAIRWPVPYQIFPGGIGSGTHHYVGERLGFSIYGDENSVFLDDLPTQTVSEIVAQVGEPDFEVWEQKFDWSFSDQTLKFEVDIQLAGNVAGAHEIVADGKTFVEAWKNGIEAIWSGGAKFVVDSVFYDFDFVVNFVTEVPDFVVTVYDKYFDSEGAPTANMLNWVLDLESLNWQQSDHGRFAAHEFGHMLGLYDEYKGGAIDPSLSFLDRLLKVCGQTGIQSYCGSLMADLGPVQERYYLSLLEFTGFNAEHAITLAMAPQGYYNFGPPRTIASEVNITGVEPVPIPAALPLLAAGLGAMGFMGWRKRRKELTVH